MGKITKEEVLKLAQLSKLTLKDDQLEKFRLELESLLTYIEQLQSVNTVGLQPTNQISGLTNVMREDVIKENVSQKELLKNTPAIQDDQIKVRRVLE